MLLHYKNFCNFSHRNLDDSRFFENEAVLHWLADWKEEVANTEGIAKTEKVRRFISAKTYFDIHSMVYGFKSFCTIMIRKFDGVHINIRHTSQDYLELFFACQRAQNGQNNNPTVLQYGKLKFAKNLKTYTGCPKNMCTV